MLTAKQKLNNLMQRLEEETLAMTDAEILEEATEEDMRAVDEMKRKILNLLREYKYGKKGG